MNQNVDTKEQGSVDVSNTSVADSSAKKTAAKVPSHADGGWGELFNTALVAIVLALIIRTFFLEPFNIPSGSMRPTLQIGDYLFVSKPAYGYSKYSFPFGMAPIDGRIGPGAEPKRGDVVVFKLPYNTSIDYIKRIVGLPGETIQVIEGELYINRRKVPRESVGLKRIEKDGKVTSIMEYKQTLPGGAKFSIYEEADDRVLDNTLEYVVPEGHYFMMGDNRDNSQDSRVLDHVGYVPLENIVGRASFLFFSTNGHAKLIEFWKWPWSIRYKRLFSSIGPERSK